MFLSFRMADLKLRVLRVCRLSGNRGQSVGQRNARKIKNVYNSKFLLQRCLSHGSTTCEVSFQHSTDTFTHSKEQQWLAAEHPRLSTNTHEMRYLAAAEARQEEDIPSSALATSHSVQKLYQTSCCSKLPRMMLSSRLSGWYFHGRSQTST